MKIEDASWGEFFFTLIIPMLWTTKQGDPEGMLETVARQTFDHRGWEFLEVMDPTAEENQALYRAACEKSMQQAHRDGILLELTCDVLWQVYVDMENEEKRKPKGFRWLRVIKGRK